jgi:hypothetical protein
MKRLKRSSLLAGLIALAGFPALAQPAQSGKAVSPEEAPQAWVAYAESATRAIGAWLSAETPPAPRIRAVIDAGRTAPDQPAPPLVLKLWIGRDGAIERVEFTPLSDAQADQDLHAMLVGRRLAPPPKGMRLPLRIGFELKPAPQGAPAA